ncbi:beta-N-acetylhexosaminidase [Rhizobium sp. FKY42]|uniref:beta-N-acetylhexosaminidase n=1 Tax=Rhizobium sp. FKY42 TaxID=2562310 RepID=UPI0010BF9F24|nr:beta-N-acetylhexosaminidase [Rhizobium sp. FKY42]
MSNCKAMILGCAGTELSAEEIALYRDQQPWGFILFARNLKDQAQIRNLVQSLRDAVGRQDAPVLIDQEGGRVQRIRAPMAENYPSGSVLGALYEQDEARGLRAAWLMSRLHAFDLTKLGININCLPVLDVVVPGGTPAIGNRSYGENTATVAAVGKAAADGLKAGGMLPVMKHMPGHGRAMVDSHHDLPVVSASIDELDAHDFLPFRQMKDELMGMSAHIVFTAIDPENPATTSRKVIDEVIRGRIGFDGLLLSDDSSMNALKGTLGERAANIISGGCDIVLHCNGVMEEMTQVVREVPLLSGKSLKRAEAALAGFTPADTSREADLRAEFWSLIPAA